MSNRSTNPPSVCRIRARQWPMTVSRETGAESIKGRGVPENAYPDLEDYKDAFDGGSLDALMGWAEEKRP